jgi:hypothetical protein
MYICVHYVYIYSYVYVYVHIYIVGLGKMGCIYIYTENDVIDIWLWRVFRQTDLIRCFKRLISFRKATGKWVSASKFVPSNQVWDWLRKKEDFSSPL